MLTLQNNIIGNFLRRRPWYDSHFMYFFGLICGQTCIYLSHIASFNLCLALDSERRGQGQNVAFNTYIRLCDLHS